MAERVTIKDIARNTGTSITSVHRALHGGGGVGEELRRRILEEAERQHYQVDESASLLRRNQLSITVLLPGPQGNERFFYRGLWFGIERAARRLQKTRTEVKMIKADCGVDRLSDALERLYDETDMAEEKMDGLITICDDEKSAAWISRFIRRGIAVALVDRSLPVDGVTCMAEVSVGDMGNLAMELADLFYARKIWEQGSDGKNGKTSTIFLANSSASRTSSRIFSQKVQDKLQEICRDRGLVLRESNEVREPEMREDLRRILRENPPAAVIAGSARATFWVCDEITRFYSEFPERKAECPPVIGMDLFPEQAPFFENGVLKASIYQSHLTSGEQCVDRLFEQLVGLNRETGTVLQQPLSVIMKDNYRSYLMALQQKKSQ